MYVGTTSSDSWQQGGVRASCSSGNECSVCILSGNSWVSPALSILINSNSNDWQRGCVGDMVVVVVILPSVLATIHERSSVVPMMASYTSISMSTRNDSCGINRFLGRWQGVLAANSCDGLPGHQRWAVSPSLNSWCSTTSHHIFLCAGSQ